MTRKNKTGASRGRAQRTFALGPPGAVLRVEYPLQRKSLLFLVVAAFALGGVSVLWEKHRLFAVLLILGGAYVGWRALRRRLGVILVEQARLQIGPLGRTHDVPLVDVLGTNRAILATMSGASAPEEDLVVRYARTPGKVEMVAALLPRAVAAELERRIGLRARAARMGHPRAVEAAEARWLAGDDVIGVVHGSEGWRPVVDTADLEKTAAHPFRGDVQKLLVCVSPSVWSAIGAVPGLGDRLEPLVVPD